MCEEVVLFGLNPYAMRRAKEGVDIQNAQHRSCARSSANEDDNDVRDGKGANKKRRRGSVSVAALHRAVRSPEEQPRLPFSSGSRDLFPLGRDPHHALPPKGYPQRLGLELALWETRAGSIFTQSDAGRLLCGAGGYLACSMLGR